MSSAEISSGPMPSSRSRSGSSPDPPAAPSLPRISPLSPSFGGAQLSPAVAFRIESPRSEAARRETAPW